MTGRELSSKTNLDFAVTHQGLGILGIQTFLVRDAQLWLGWSSERKNNFLFLLAVTRKRSASSLLAPRHTSARVHPEWATLHYNRFSRFSMSLPQLFLVFFLKLGRIRSVHESCA